MTQSVNGLFCADVPLRNYTHSITHLLTYSPLNTLEVYKLNKFYEASDSFFYVIIVCCCFVKISFCRSVQSAYSIIRSEHKESSNVVS